MEAINHIWEREEELSDVVCSGTMASEKFLEKKENNNNNVSTYLGENFKPNKSPPDQSVVKNEIR